MNTYRDFIRIKTDHVREIRDITASVSQIIARSGIREGFIQLFPHSTTSAVCVGESDASLAEDFLAVVDRLVPEGTYRHDASDARKNARAHLMSVLTGQNLSLPVTEGSLDIGVYQRIYYTEFDGCREKELLIKIIGE